MALISPEEFLKRLLPLLRNPATYFWLLLALLVANISLVNLFEKKPFVANHRDKMVIIPFFSLIAFVCVYFAVKIMPLFSGLFSPDTSESDALWSQVGNILNKNANAQSQGMVGALSASDAQSPDGNAIPGGPGRPPLTPEEEKRIQEINDIFKPCRDLLGPSGTLNGSPEQAELYNKTYMECVRKMFNHGSGADNENPNYLAIPGTFVEMPCSSLPGADPDATGTRRVAFNGKGQYPIVSFLPQWEILQAISPRYTLLWCGKREALETEQTQYGLDQILGELAALGVLAGIHYTDNPDRLPAMAPDCHQLLEHHQALAGFFLIEKGQIIRFWFGQEAFPGLLVWLRGQSS